MEQDIGLNRYPGADHEESPTSASREANARAHYDAPVWEGPLCRPCIFAASTGTPMSVRTAFLIGPLALTSWACGTPRMVVEPEPAPAPVATTPTAPPGAPAPVTPPAVSLDLPDGAELSADDADLQRRIGQYRTVRLTSDLSGLSTDTRRMLSYLIAAAREMDAVFWMEASGPRDAVLARMPSANARRYAEINYGPWDRLAGNEPFVAGVDAKPRGANFYPHDMTAEELDAAAADDPSLRSLYTLVRRGADGGLVSVPYHEAFATQHRAAARIMREAARYADDAGLRRYLELRADALENDDYQASDFAWMEMRTNPIDFVVGPIETYEDALLGAKAAHEAYVLIKDMAWSERLARYAELLPALQEGLPVEARYRAETPGTDADLGAYDAIYYAGDSNAGSKTIAINLPNDEEVQLRAGSRRLQLKNVMRAKFDEIVVPIAAQLIVPEQRGNVTFEAFFGNTMFHEVAHGLGIKNTLNGAGTVREALRDQASPLEEGKADVLGLYMVTSLIDSGEWTDATLMEHYTTFVTGIFRSIRFGASSAHGRANLVRLNFFREMGAMERNADGQYTIDPVRMRAAVDALSGRILTLQGDGDYDAVVTFVDQYGVMTPELEADLARLANAGIPVDVVFEQGEEVLGLPLYLTE